MEKIGGHHSLCNYQYKGAFKFCKNGGICMRTPVKIQNHAYV